MEITEQQFKQLQDKIDNLSERYQQHNHNKLNGFAINPKDLLGFPTIQVSNATTAPIDAPINGTIRFYYDGTNCVEWVRINNTWEGVSLVILPAGLAGTFTYYVASTSGGSPTVKLTFKNGVLINNT